MFDFSEKKVLVKIKKENGKEIDEIIFDNIRPVYEVDPTTQSIYYIYENELRIFNKKKI